NRRLPVGEINVSLNTNDLFFPIDFFDKFLLADEFKVRGFSVRVREPGVGTPLLGISKPNKNLRISRTAPVTAFLRLGSSLKEIADGQGASQLELYSIFDRASVMVGGASVPLEADITAPRAYTMNQTFAWRVE